MNPGDRFLKWAHGRAKSPLCGFPNRCGLYVLERHEEFADLAMAEKPTSDELLAYIVGIGESVK